MVGKTEPRDEQMGRFDAAVRPVDKVPEVMWSETVAILTGAALVIAVIFGVGAAVRSTSGQQGAQAAGEADPSDIPGVIAPPPLIYVGFLAAAAVLEALMPLPGLPSAPAARYVIGVVLAALGIAVIIAGARRFIAAGTNLPPMLPTTALVTDGPYRWSRNPLYLAMLTVYLGIAIAAGGLWGLVLAVPLLWLINVAVVAREERYLERKFGDVYRQYRAGVRRWL
jgi:protein-S-isoprenylcysteine O-methyltransferase Ste14